MSGRRRWTPGPAARLAVSLAVLGALALLLDTGRILSRLRQIRPAWALLVLGVSVLQVAASAWRWRFTAKRLGLGLPFRDALGEYYLATFLNQVLPGGVAGDVSRAWRHARGRDVAEGRKGTAVRAVVLERASGQAVMAVVAGVSFLALPLPVVAAGPGAGVVLAALAALGGALLLVLVRARSGGAVPTAAARLWRDARSALLSRGAISAQVASSGVVVACCLVMYLAAARAVGVEAPFGALLPLVAPILVAMLLPVSIAGWGVREGAAAALWSTAGLPAAEGVAVSVTYGVLVLVSSAPGGLVLVRNLVTAGRSRAGKPGRNGAVPTLGRPVSAGPDRRERRRPERSGGMADAGPRGASRSAPA